MITAKQILKAIGEPRLALYKGEGYWYFAFDDAGMFETHSVPTMRLNDAPSIDWWVAEGKPFAERCIADMAERAAAPAFIPGEPIKLGWKR